MRMFFAAEWHDRAERIHVTNPFNGELIDTVPRGTVADVERAIATLVEGAKLMRAMPSIPQIILSRRSRNQVVVRTPASELITDRT